MLYGVKALINLQVFLIHKLYSFPGDSVVKNLPVNIEDAGSIPGLERSSAEGNGNPVQYSYLRNPMDKGAWKGYSPWGHKESEMTY